ncbi:MAG: hypothetical protein AB1Z98_30255 [Nannocystaceae bacterium]
MDRTFDELRSDAFASRGFGLSEDALQFEVPKTRAQFRELVESLDLTTRTGRKAYDTLLDIAPLFASLTDDAESLENALSRLTGRQGIIATLQDQVFVAAQLQNGVTTADPEIRGLLTQIVEEVRAGNIVIARNTGITAAEARRTNLEANLA